MTGKNAKKKHHYIPQLHLREFYDSDKKLWVFDRQYGSYNSRSAAAVAYLHDYYTVDMVDEKNSTQIEEMFSKVESVAKPLLVKLANGDEIKPVERGDIAVFLALQVIRVPEMARRFEEATVAIGKKAFDLELEHLASNKTAFKAAKLAIQKEHGSKVKITQKKIRKMIEDKSTLEIDVPRSYTIGSTLTMADDIQRGLNQLDWHVLRAPKNRAFITSDNPFTALHDAPLAPNSVNLFPLNKYRALLIGHTKNAALTYQDVTDKEVREFNDAIAIHSNRYLMSHSKELLSSVVTRTATRTSHNEPRTDFAEINLTQDGSQKLMVMTSTKVRKTEK